MPTSMSLVEIVAEHRQARQQHGGDNRQAAQRQVTRQKDENRSAPKVTRDASEHRLRQPVEAGVERQDHVTARSRRRAQDDDHGAGRSASSRSGVSRPPRLNTLLNSTVVLLSRLTQANIRIM